MKRHFISANATIDELAAKAAEWEKQATGEREPHATELREQAKLCRWWIGELRSGR